MQNISSVGNFLKKISDEFFKTLEIFINFTHQIFTQTQHQIQTTGVAMTTW
jgi:hypothetical protein